MAEREESYTRTESVAKWSREARAAYEVERSSVVCVCFFLSVHGGVLIRRKIYEYTMRRDGIFFSSS